MSCKYQIGTLKYGRLKRITHLVIVIACFGLLFTEIINQYFYSKSAIMESFEFSFSGIGLQDTPPVDRLFIAKLLRREVWGWHFWFGVVLLSTTILHFLNNKKNILNIALFLIVLVLFVSGLPLWVRAYTHIPQNIQDPCRLVHSITVYALYAFVFIHVSLVIKNEFKQPGYISRMITGSLIK